MEFLIVTVYLLLYSEYFFIKNILQLNWNRKLLYYVSCMLLEMIVVACLVLTHASSQLCLGHCWLDEIGEITDDRHKTFNDAYDIIIYNTVQ